jgi:hypothetical protein
VRHRRATENLDGTRGVAARLEQPFEAICSKERILAWCSEIVTIEFVSMTAGTQSLYLKIVLSDANVDNMSLGSGGSNPTPQLRLATRSSG